MKHTTWLQNQTPACALDGKTPYKMKNNKKPHLTGIQEFGVTTYVWDLKAGMLNAHAQVDRFVGYNLESKGYWIYWPQKWSITVEWNIVFNESDVLTNDDMEIIAGGAIAEGGRNKVIQPPTSNPNTPTPMHLTPHLNLGLNIQFHSLLKPEIAKDPLPEPLSEEDPSPELGHGWCAQRNHLPHTCEWLLDFPCLKQTLQSTSWKKQNMTPCSQRTKRAVQWTYHQILCSLVLLVLSQGPQ